MNLYESDIIQDVFGEALRPGGLELTKRALEYCKFNSGDKLLDLGCGSGATISYINKHYNFSICGLDISDKLVSQARRLNEETEIFISSAENMDFENSTFNGVFAECTLSLMDDLEKTLKEINRVTRNEGYLIISDIYVNNTEYLEKLKKVSVNTCLKKPFDLKDLNNLLENSGFHVELQEKHDNLLIQLLADIIFKFGSMDILWSCTRDCTDMKSFQNSLIKSKPGYFLMIARKEKDYA